MDLLLLKFYFYNCGVGSHKRTQRKYCMFSFYLRLVLYKGLMMDWFTTKHVAKPTKENISCVSTGNFILFSFTLVLIGSYRIVVSEVARHCY